MGELGVCLSESEELNEDMDEGMSFPSYNGWENKFTWLVHLHLSNEAHLMEEIMALVAGEPNDGTAGRLVEMWVKAALTHWLTCFPGRNRVHDESLRLLAWNVVGSALAYAEWETLVLLLTGEPHISENLFTMTVYRSILQSPQLQQHARIVLSEASSLYGAADALQDWFEIQIDAWIDTSAANRQRQAAITLLAHGLIQNTYTVIFWEHVARAFRPDY